MKPELARRCFNTNTCLDQIIRTRPSTVAFAWDAWVCAPRWLSSSVRIWNNSHQSIYTRDSVVSL